MHAEAKSYIASVADRFQLGVFPYPLTAVDLGGRETNGHARDVFGPAIEWVVVDAVAGRGVDVVSDAATFGDADEYDVVMCAEVFEHTPRWPLIVANAYRILDTDGYFITTMAGPGRAVHGVNHDDPDQPGWYENIQPRWLKIALEAAGFSEIEVSENKQSFDVYAWARK